MTPSLHATVTGKVQGVYFRAWVCDQAQSLDLTGWVRNLQDGKVEVLVQGAPDALEEFKKRLPQGSPLSRVDAVTVKTVDDEKHYADFQIRG